MICSQQKLVRLNLTDVVSIRAHRALSTCCFALSALLVVAIVFSASAHAAFFPYPDMVGTDVDYVNISENSVTDPGPLFGAPTIIGNQLDFDPSGFAATATGPGGVDITDGQLNFEVCAHNGKVVSSLKLMEAGDFTLFGAGTAATAVSVSTPTYITITEVDGLPFAGPTLATNMVFVPVGNPPAPFGNYNLTTHAGVGTQWSGVLMADITQMLIDEGITFNSGATKIEVVLDNVLTATSETGTTSLIAKKDFTGFSIVPNFPIIPEPSTIGLVIVGLLAVASARRRSNS